MNRRSRLVLLVGAVFLIIALALIFVGFRSQRSSTGDAGKSSGEQSKLATVTLGNVAVRAEVAAADRDRRRGLAGRTSLGESKGMLFVFDRPGPYAMTMQGMAFPLDILWIRDGRVIDVAMDVPIRTDTPVIVSPERFATSVLEVNAGFITRHRITIDTPVTFTFDENIGQ